jgi:ABC-type sugar transport system permease subunit
MNKVSKGQKVNTPGRRLSLNRRQSLSSFAFVAPWVIGFIVFTMYPLVQTVVFSFRKVRVTGLGIRTTDVGAANYRDIFTADVSFIGSLTDYLKEIVVYVPLILVFSLIIAMLLNRDMKGTGVLRTIFFLPVIIASGPVLHQLTANGALYLPGNFELIESLTASGAWPRWVTDSLSFLINSFTEILWNCGLQILIFLVGLQKIDANIYEAARIDGASGWEIFWKLTIRILNPMIIMNLIMTVIILSCFSNNPIISKIRVDLYEPGRGFGYASALTMIYFVIEIAVLGLGLLLVWHREKDKG